MKGRPEKMFLDHGAAWWFRKVMCEEKLNLFPGAKQVPALLTLTMIRSRSSILQNVVIFCTESTTACVENFVFKSCTLVTEWELGVEADIFYQIKTRTIGAFVVI